MVPADYKDWWLAAAALTTSLGSSPLSAQQAEPPQAGIISASQGATRAFGVEGKPGERVVYMGDKTYRQERLLNESAGITHILFLDQSSMTLGPGAEIILDEFVYDPDTRTGSISATLLTGLVRVVGGDISKTNETLVKTPVGTIGIRGGISMVEHSQQNTSATFLFGQQMRATSSNGNTVTVTRPGFGTSIATNGVPDAPTRTPVTVLNRMNSSLETGSNNSGGGSQGSNPAPGGGSNTLISTGGSGNSVSGLSGDRLQTNNTQQDNTNVSQTLRNTLGSGQTPNQS
jgi:hypothetical protein